MSFFYRKMLYDGLMSHKSEPLSVLEIKMHMDHLICIWVENFLFHFQEIMFLKFLIVDCYFPRIDTVNY